MREVKMLRTSTGEDIATVSVIFIKPSTPSVLVNTVCWFSYTIYFHLPRYIFILAPLASNIFFSYFFFFDSSVQISFFVYFMYGIFYPATFYLNFAYVYSLSFDAFKRLCNIFIC